MALLIWVEIRAVTVDVVVLINVEMGLKLQ